MRQNLNCCNCRKVRSTQTCWGEPFFCPRVNSFVLRGPRGLPGPRGPQGLPGVSAISNFGNFSNAENQNVASGESVDLGAATVLVGNAILAQARSDSISLLSGTYLIFGNLSGVSSSDGCVSFSLNIGSQNNVFLDLEDVDDNQTFSLGGNTIVLVGENSSLSIVNISQFSVEVQNISLSIVKLV